MSGYFGAESAERLVEAIGHGSLSNCQSCKESGMQRLRKTTLGLG